jgi:hypothetical protein
MENVVRRACKWISLRDVPSSVLKDIPRPSKRCDALGCEATATECCSSHGVHLCRAHYALHRQEWHSSAWESIAVARA